MDTKESQQWKDDSQEWPPVTKQHITSYLVDSRACDGLPNAIYKSLDAYDMVHSGWVDTIYHRKLDQDNTVLKAKVRPSQSISKSDYECLVYVRQDGTVVTAECSCMAGKGKGCSHVAALLFKVYLAHREGVSGLTCTDKKCQWNRGTKRAVQPNVISSMDFCSTKLADPGSHPSTSTSEPPKRNHFSSSAELKQYCEADSFLSALKDIPNSMFCKAVSTDLSCSVTSTPSVINHSNHGLDYSKPVTDLRCHDCNKLYNKYINVSSEKKDMIEKMTSEQNCEFWLACRKMRISASTAFKVPKRESTDPANFLESHLYGKFLGNAATRHGNLCEPLARSEYEQSCNKIVKTCGLIIHSTEPWLCASPDGLVGNNTILEIKSPHSDDVASLLASGKYDLDLRTGVPVLLPTGKHGYYFQVQVTMECTQRSKCDFLVWHNFANQFTVAEVTKDEVFISQLMTRLRKYYFTHILPKLVDDINSGVFILPDKFVNFFDS